MSWIASNRKELRILLAVTILSTIMILPSFAIMNIEQMTSNDLGITPIFQHKDTPMLCLDGCPLVGDHAWDAIHIVEGVLDVQSCDHCGRMCGYASIAAINHHYGGNISQNRLQYFLTTSPEGWPFFDHPEEDLIHLGLGTRTEPTKVLSWALNNATIYYYDGKPTLNEIKQWIDQNRPILTLTAPPLHFVVTDGYDDSYLHLIDPTSAKEYRVLYEDLGTPSHIDIGRVWVPPADATARNDEPEIWMDSDFDGIVDFDEINRFFTNPNDPDTDKDGINDKEEIKSYTFLPNGSFDSEDILLPDADEDGYRAELDPDDNDPTVPAPLIANFSYDPEKPRATKPVTFTSTSEGMISEYTWDFGDDNETTVSTPTITHRYQQPGNYTVTLTISNNDKSNLTSKTLMVYYLTDLNQDRTVNIVDISTVAIAFGTKEGDEYYNPIADLDDNKQINIVDVSIVAIDYGKTV